MMAHRKYRNHRQKKFGVPKVLQLQDQVRYNCAIEQVV